MKKTLKLLILLCFLAFTGNGQTTQVAASGDDCTIANQRLEKVLTDLDKSEAEKHSLEVSNAVHEKSEANKDGIIEAQKQIVKLQADEIEIFRRTKCNTVSFLFGILKSKKCF